ncbi:hypothetical protein ACJJTC_013086 [Scirpophaga incertulas]
MEMKSCSIHIYVLFLFMNIYKSGSHLSTKELVYASIPRIIKAAGYALEKHEAHTADGYSIGMYRIPRGRTKNLKTNSKGQKRAVVLVHGLMSDCDNFLIMGRQKSLGFLLADAGYDVWLANLRGTPFSSHKSLNKNNTKFWEFSFHEHGKYDAPAIIDKILVITGLSKILYVGYSMGTSTCLAMLALRPNYNEKLVAFVALAPAAYADNFKKFNNVLTNILDLKGFLHKMGMLTISMPPEIMEFICDSYCTNKTYIPDVCMQMIYLLVGENPEQYVEDMTKVILMRLQPASIQQYYHYVKISFTGVFTSWEDGLNGKVKPYNLTNVRVPVSLWYGENDRLTEKTGVLRLATQLNDTGALYATRFIANFNHLDFILARDVASVVSKPVLVHINELYDKFD